MNLPPVLYVEDDANDAFFLCDAWEQAGIRNPLIEVKDGSQAIDCILGQGRFSNRQQYPLPCLLLLDLKLPGKSGFEVLEWLRQHPTLKSLKVVVLSGSDQPADVARAESLGVMDYVVKPSRPGDLVEIVRKNKDRWLADGKQG